MTSAAPTVGLNAGSEPRRPSASARITNPTAIPAHVAPMRLRMTRSSVTATGAAGASDGGGKVAARSAFHQLVLGCGGPEVAYVPEGASAGGGDEGGTLAARGGGGVMGGRRRVSSRSSTSDTSWVESWAVRSMLASFMGNALTPRRVKRQHIRSECTFPGEPGWPPRSPRLARLFPGVFARCKHARPQGQVDLQ